MDPRHASLAAGSTDDLSSPYLAPLGDPDLAQIGKRDLQPWDRRDRDCLHPCNRTGKGDNPGDRSTNRISHVGRVVDAPVACVLATRGIAGRDRAVHRSDQTNRGNGERAEHHLSPGGHRIGVTFQ